MSEIRIDTAQIRKNQGNLKTDAKELAALNKRLAALLVKMESSWQGKGAEAYLATMRTQSEKLTQMVHVLEQLQGYMDKAVTTFDSADKNHAKIIGGC
ncbi:MAG: WXG100 family type VII secretion target [Lachnospiraceae bacterium]|nr:WXG100 family type VII secretion target [Lachnospiraceae bacterium]